MRGICYNKIVSKLNTTVYSFSEKKNILEIGCGSKIYKKLFNNHNYFGLDKLNSEWVCNTNTPELCCELKDLQTDLSFDFVFSVASVYLLDDVSLVKLVELLDRLKKIKGRCLIFDYKRKTIEKLGNEYNFYLEILKKNFNSYLCVNYNYEWCSNSILKSFIKEIILKGKFNQSLMIDINFNL